MFLFCFRVFLCVVFLSLLIQSEQESEQNNSNHKKKGKQKNSNNDNLLNLFSHCCTMLSGWCLTGWCGARSGFSNAAASFFHFHLGRLPTGVALLWMCGGRTFDALFQIADTKAGRTCSVCKKKDRSKRKIQIQTDTDQKKKTRR